jgi:hypothetical protein
MKWTRKSHDSQKMPSHQLRKTAEGYYSALCLYEALLRAVVHEFGLFKHVPMREKVCSQNVDAEKQDPTEKCVTKCTR